MEGSKSGIGKISPCAGNGGFLAALEMTVGVLEMTGGWSK